MITDEQVEQLFKDIDEGRVTVKPTRETWKEAWAGDVEFTCSNGWRVVVFNDCDEWDYVDSVIAPDGDKATWGGDIWADPPKWSNWHPRDPAPWIST